MNKSNCKIKNYANGKGVKQWQIADKLGIHEKTLCVKMRYALSEEEQERIISIIDEIAESEV